MRFMTLILLAWAWITGSLHAENTDAWQFDANGNFLLNSYVSAEQVNSQYELSAFINASHLDTGGFSLGYIRQDQAISSRQSVVNNIAYLGGWRAYYADALSGRFIASMDYYAGNEHVTGQDGGNGGSPGMMNKMGFFSASTPFTDDLRVLNPALGFITYSKTFYAEVSYARSDYDASDTGIGDLTVKQWSPAIALQFNNQYDRVQLRHYAIELSSTARTAGVDDTSAYELTWGHWYSAGTSGPTSIHAALLWGERLYAVDREARKIYNLADMQKSAASLGAVWQLRSDMKFYAYGGLERYTNLDLDENYTGLFLYLGISRQW